MPLITTAEEESTGLQHAIHTSHGERPLDNSVLHSPQQRIEASSSCREQLKHARHRPIFDAKNADEVAAALRFKLVLERNESADNCTHLLKSLDREESRVKRLALEGISPGITKSRLTRVRDSQSVMKRTNKPSALQFQHENTPPPLEIKSATLPDRSGMSTYHDVFRPKESLQRSRTISVLKSESHRVFGGGRRKRPRRQKSDIPPLPSCIPMANLEHPNNTRTEISSESVDGQGIRLVREETISLRKRTDETASGAMAGSWGLCESESPSGSSESDSWRTRNPFRWLQRRSELEDLIDLYMNDEQLDAINLEKKAVKPRWITIWPV